MFLRASFLKDSFGNSWDLWWRRRSKNLWGDGTVRLYSHSQPIGAKKQSRRWTVFRIWRHTVNDHLIAVIRQFNFLMKMKVLHHLPLKDGLLSPSHLFRTCWLFYILRCLWHRILCIRPFSVDHLKEAHTKWVNVCRFPVVSVRCQKEVRTFALMDGDKVFTGTWFALF